MFIWSRFFWKLSRHFQELPINFAKQYSFPTLDHKSTRTIVQFSLKTLRFSLVFPKERLKPKGYARNSRKSALFRENPLDSYSKLVFFKNSSLTNEISKRKVAVFCGKSEKCGISKEISGKKLEELKRSPRL